MSTAYALIHAQLGAVSIPLIIFAVFTVILLLEAVWRLLVALWWMPLKAEALRYAEAKRVLDQRAYEIEMTLWLSKRAKHLHRGEAMLALIAGAAPALGLLGTVLGLMQAFYEIEQVSGPIDPGVLAAGLGVAMKTTAVGLAIALPAFVGVQLQNIVVNRIIGDVEEILNTVSMGDEVHVAAGARV